MKRLMRLTLGAMLLAAATSAASNDAVSNEAVMEEAAANEVAVNEVALNEVALNEAAVNEVAVAGAAAGSEDGSHAQAPIPQEVDLFPSQPWASLVGRNTPQAVDGARDSTTSQAAENNPLAPDQAPGDPELVLVPIHAVGEWSDDADRIVVLESQGQTYLLCQRCSIADALRPGDTVAQQYQFKALEPLRAVLLDPKGREQHIDLAPLAQ